MAPEMVTVVRIAMVIICQHPLSMGLIGGCAVGRGARDVSQPDDSEELRGSSERAAGPACGRADAIP